MDSSSTSRKVITGDDNVFEINDFTVVTEFEVLVLTLENAIQEMKTAAELENDMASNELNTLSQRTRPQRIASTKFDYLHYEFQMDYFKQNYDCPEFDEEFREKHDYLCDAAFALISPEHDFFEETTVYRQYGTSSGFFLVHLIGKNNYITESTVHMVMSGINVASLNTECDLPIFFQFAHGASVGVLQNRHCFTNFEGAVLNNCLRRQKYLDGVIEMFRQKIKAPIGTGRTIKVSLQHDFRHNLGDETSTEDLALSTDSSRDCPHTYPFVQADHSLLRELRLCALWLDVDENLLAETDNFSNIDPQSAHKWKFAVRFDPEFSFEQSFIFTRLIELADEEFSDCTVKSQVPAVASHSLGTTALGPLINKPIVRDIDIIGIGDTSFSREQNSLTECVNFIMGTDEKSGTEDEHFSCLQKELLAKIKQAKSAPANSLTRRLAQCLISKIDGNFVAFCRLWLKFLEILRHHWEYNLALPSFSEDERPQITKCLLHQKLQMLQYCIMVKKRKHRDMEANEQQQHINTDGDGKTISSVPSSTNTNTDDEFFDANESFVEVEDGEAVYSASLLPTPSGRSHPLESNECLKNHPNECIYIPFTQDEGPMTEDQIEQRESYLVSLEDTDMRTRAQSELLLSDMQAFKAANPGCILEDFLRWHSPRDLIEGELSERMKLPGNLWQETWCSARPVPASQQTRLFNETREAEQIFQSFTNMRVKELVLLLLPVVSAHMAEILVKIATECQELLKPVLEKLCNEIGLATRNAGDMDAFFEVGRSLRLAEELVMRYSSTADILLEQAKRVHLAGDIELSVFSAFVSELCKNSSASDELLLDAGLRGCAVPDAPYGPIFNTLRSFVVSVEDEDQQWPAPIRKQTIIRGLIPHPGSGSRPMPQRMYISYREGEFILRGSFTSDITFV